MEGTDHPPPPWQTPETHLGHSRKSVITSIGTYDRLKSMPRVFASAELNGKKKKKIYDLYFLITLAGIVSAGFKRRR